MDLTLGKPAVCVVDMQYDFVGKSAVIPCMADGDVIAANQRLLEAVRSRGIPIIYTQEIHRANHVDFGRELDRKEPVHCIEGTRGVQILDELAPQPGDYILQKRRYSAFFQTDLLLLLQGLAVDTLIITGAATDVCVRATATDAQQYGYFVLVPRECVAGTSPLQHQAALEHIDYVLGRVVALEDLLQAIYRS